MTGLLPQGLAFLHIVDLVPETMEKQVHPPLKYLISMTLFVVTTAGVLMFGNATASADCSTRSGLRTITNVASNTNANYYTSGCWNDINASYGSRTPNVGLDMGAVTCGVSWQWISNPNYVSWGVSDYATKVLETNLQDGVCYKLRQRYPGGGSTSANYSTFS